MKTIEKVAKEIVKLNDGWCGNFDYENTLCAINPSLKKEAHLVMKWIIDEFLPSKSDCKFFNINRDLLIKYYNSIK